VVEVGGRSYRIVIKMMGAVDEALRGGRAEYIMGVVEGGWWEGVVCLSFSGVVRITWNVAVEGSVQNGEGAGDLFIL